MRDLATLAIDILWLGDPACSELAEVGGKAAQLSRLAEHFPVPPGFCLPASMLAVLSTAGAGPAVLYDALAAAYQELEARCGIQRPRVAVRSSAVDEDGQSASFAGQHATYLNLVGPEAIAEAVMRCWASAQTPQARAYRARHGLAAEHIRVAVLVQQLVLADVSGVVFSANPVTGSRDDVVITATWGLGESLVGGTVTPDTYLVRKRDLAIASRHVGDKRHMTVITPDGTREVEVPRMLRSEPVLGDAQIGELARLAVALESTMAWPVDLEIAFAEDRLFLLQCRPITTLEGDAES